MTYHFIIEIFVIPLNKLSMYSLKQLFYSGKNLNIPGRALAFKFLLISSVRSTKCRFVLFVFVGPL